MVRPKVKLASKNWANLIKNKEYFASSQKKFTAPGVKSNKNTKQLLYTQIPQAQKDTIDLTVFFVFLWSGFLKTSPKHDSEIDSKPLINAEEINDAMGLRKNSSDVNEKQKSHLQSN